MLFMFNRLSYKCLIRLFKYNILYFIQLEGGEGKTTNPNKLIQKVPLITVSLHNLGNLHLHYIPIIYLTTKSNNDVI